MLTRFVIAAAAVGAALGTLLGWLSYDGDEGT